MSAVRNDLIAGAVSATVMLPQAALLAEIAGMPPEYGVYASVFPALLATLLGPNRQLLTGPNSALALMTATAVVPFASPGTHGYINLVLLLTAMAGIFQIMLCALRGHALFDFIPAGAVTGVTNSVGITIVMSQLAITTGILCEREDPFWINLWRVACEFPGWDWTALTITASTLLVHQIFYRTCWRSFAIPLAIIGGSATAGLFRVWGWGQLEMLGHMPVSLVLLNLPNLDQDSVRDIFALIPGAAGIAFVGLLQTAIISRRMAGGSVPPPAMRREILAQGIANLVAAVTSGLPVSGSFNRTAAHLAAGATTRLASIAASLMLLAAGLLLAPVLAYLPLAVMSAVLLIVGVLLVDWSSLRHSLHQNPQRPDVRLIGVTTFVGIFCGIVPAVLLSVTFALYRYLSRARELRITHLAPELQFDHVLAVAGQLFFASGHLLESALQTLNAMPGTGKSGLVKLNVSYIDAESCAMLQRQQEQWQRSGDLLVIDRRSCSAFTPHLDDWDLGDILVTKESSLVKGQK